VLRSLGGQAVEQAMKVVYAAPNRSHHYPYAVALASRGALGAFVSGFPRFGKQAAIDLPEGTLKRRDSLQLLYLAALRTPLLRQKPAEWLAYLSKCYLDRASLRWAREADVFLAYNGCALSTFSALQGSGTRRVLEVVNSHVSYQDELLAEEHDRCGLSYKGVFSAEKCRRLQEYEICDHILCPSSFVARSLIARGIPQSKILRNSYGFRRIPTDGRPPVMRNGKRLLYVGSVSVRKGLRYLIEALRLVKWPGVTLDIVGPMTGATGLENMTLPSNVKFHGVLKTVELGAMFSQSDVFVLPSIEEGQALVVGEALGFGLPIITTENSGADDIITDGREGYIVPIRDAPAIAEKIEKLLGDDEMRRTMGEEATHTAQLLGGWEVAGNRLVDTLQAIY